MEQQNNSNNSINLDANIQATLSYIPLVGVIFFLISKDEFVRFHAMQSIVLMVLSFGLSFIAGITVILAILVPFINLALFIAAIFAAFKAYKNEKYELPVIGNLTNTALKAVNK